MKRRQKRSSGFTLLELLMVVIIIGILAALALPGYYRAAERSRAAEALTILGQIRGAAQRYCIENPGGALAACEPGGADSNALDIEMPAAGATNWDYTSCTVTCGAAGAQPTVTATASRNAGPCGAVGGVGSQITMSASGATTTSIFSYSWIGPCA